MEFTLEVDVKCTCNRYRRYRYRSKHVVAFMRCLSGYQFCNNSHSYRIESIFSKIFNRNVQYVYIAYTICFSYISIRREIPYEETVVAEPAESFPT